MNAPASVTIRSTDGVTPVTTDDDDDADADALLPPDDDGASQLSQSSHSLAVVATVADAVAADDGDGSLTSAPTIGNERLPSVYDIITQQ
jgi:hypothetical protein